jgi:hypothetical protein
VQHGRVDAVGLGLLFGGQLGAGGTSSGHRTAPAGGISDRHSSSRTSDEKATNFRDAYPDETVGGLLVDAGGVIVEIDNFSGTFRFGAEVFPQVLAELAAQGADVSSVREVAIDYD